MIRNELTYRIVRSDRRTIAVQILPDGEVVVRCGRRVPEREVRRFVCSKEAWIRKQQEKLSAQPCMPALTEDERKALVKKAKTVLLQRVAYYAPLVGVTYGRITVRSQRSRWGSCSGRGNLSFNCLLMLTPPEVADYVVVHELCHRKQMNHSAAFWGEVGRILPDYNRQKKWLKENGPALLGRLGK